MPSLALLDAEDDEVGEPGFQAGEITEGKGLVHGLAVLIPQPDNLGLGFLGLGSSGCVALVERRAVASFEETS